MGFLDRLFGRGREPVPQPPQQSRRQLSPDEQAVERYTYLLRTASPDQIEAVHAEAFAKLTPQQRRQVLEAVGSQLPDGQDGDDPQALARAATRMEMSKPGSLQTALGRGQAGAVGMGGILAGSLLASVAGAFIGNALAHQMFGPDPGADWDQDLAGDEASGAGELGAADSGQAGHDQADSFGGGDFGGGDFSGGDLGGGDFGGLDF